MNNIKKIVTGVVLVISYPCFAQNTDVEKDSIYIHEIEDAKEPAKVLHAEPLYIDLIRDLGARKGEKEWNIGLGLTDNLKFDSYEALIEYEWAPIDRLGFEIEVPFTFYSPSQSFANDSIPSNQINSLKLATQWSFFVNEDLATSIAIGYINEFEISDFDHFSPPSITGNIYNPFFIVAKRWGNNFHSLIYTGPVIEQHYKSRNIHVTYDINTSFHYMISGTRNFIGVEFNKSMDRQNFDMTVRPQMRLEITDHLMIGIVAGVPVSKKNERLSSFLRLIWEPEPSHK